MNRYRLHIDAGDVSHDSAGYGLIEYAQCFGVEETVALFREWLAGQVAHADRQERIEARRRQIKVVGGLKFERERRY